MRTTGIIVYIDSESWGKGVKVHSGLKSVHWKRWRGLMERMALITNHRFMAQYTSSLVWGVLERHPLLQRVMMDFWVGMALNANHRHRTAYKISLSFAEFSGVTSWSALVRAAKNGGGHLDGAGA